MHHKHTCKPAQTLWKHSPANAMKPVQLNLHTCTHNIKARCTHRPHTHTPLHTSKHTCLHSCTFQTASQGTGFRVVKSVEGARRSPGSRANGQSKEDVRCKGCQDLERQRDPGEPEKLCPDHEHTAGGTRACSAPAKHPGASTSATHAVLVILSIALNLGQESWRTLH